jgi:hypothetical protein
MGKLFRILKTEVWILFFFFAVIAGCEEEKTNLVYELKQPDKIAKEVYEVYSAIINNQFKYQEYVVIQQETDTIVKEDYCYTLYENPNNDLDSSIIGDYIGNNHQSYNLGYDHFQTEGEVKLITRKELNSYEGMENFHENYPEAEGVLYFTFPGFNKDSTRALFEYTWHTSDNKAENYMVYLNKDKDEWHIMVRELTD